MAPRVPRTSWADWLVTVRADRSDSNLVGQIMILFLLLGFQRIPPLSENLTHRPVVLVWMSLMDKCTVTFTEYHERIHRPAHVVAQAVFGLDDTDRPYFQSIIHITATNKKAPEHSVVFH